MATVEELWAAFAAARPDLAGPATTFEAWHFCDNQADADELVELVLAGRKTATAGALWSYEDEGEPAPQPGSLSVVTDWSGAGRCVIRTVAVEIVPFDEVSPEFAAAEGEGDLSLAFWREAHWAAFSREFEGTERSPAPDMPVVCERFEVVYPSSARTRPISTPPSGG